MKKIITTFLCLAVLGGLFMFGVQGNILQAGDGQAILETRCTKCHGAGRIERAGFDRDMWEVTVDRMMGKRGFGEALSDAEYQTLLDHLETL